jgi:2'-5' RNA ligase
MITVNCHSLWLVPRGTAHLKLSEIIRALSERYGTPRFAPHVTLLGQTLKPRREIIAITREVASEHEAIPIKLMQPAYTSDYFRSLFIEAEPSNALLAARKLAVERFGLSAKYDFRPHLSLLYGDLCEAQKQAIIANLGNNFPRRFFAESIDVYVTEGRPEQWRLVESVALPAAAQENSGGG